jgi:putative spermidine/putrescine transport system permease protein
MSARLAGKLLLCALAFVIIFGPLSGLVIWSFAEKWYWPHLLPSQWGGMYWEKAFDGELLKSLVTGLQIALATTGAVAAISIPLAYALVRFKVPAKRLILVLFLLPQAFPSLPIFANLTTLFYQWNLAGKIAGVAILHIGGAFIYSIWTMVSVFQSIPPVLEEAARSMGASRLRVFAGISLPLAVPGVITSSLLVFLYSLDEFAGTLLIGAPFVKTLPVQMYIASMGYEMQTASVTSLIITAPGVLLLLCFERFMKSEYLSSFGRI